MDCMISKLNKNTHFRCNYKFELQEDKKYFGDIKIRQLINNSNNINEMNKLGQYCSNSGDNTYLRGILKKN